MPKAIRFYQPGGPEVLVWEEVPVGKPGPGEARVRHTAVGLNYVDIYIRRGLFSTSRIYGEVSIPSRCRAVLGPRPPKWSRRSAQTSPTSSRVTASPMPAGPSVPIARSA